MKDKARIREIALKSWLFAYKNVYKEKTIRKEISNYYSDSNFDKYFEEIKKGVGRFIVAISKNKIAGYAHVSRKNKEWEIMRLYMDPGILRQGIGSKLILKVENFLKTKRVNKYFVYPHTKNKYATNFYKKKGFVRNPKRDRACKSPCFEKKI